MLFVVDAKAGVTPGDEELAEILRGRDGPCSYSRTSSTTRGATLEALEFHRLGLGDPIPVSALHGHGSGDLLDEIVRRLPGRGENARRGGGDQGRDPRPPERREVVAAERARRARARHRLRGPRNDARRDRHGAHARRLDLRARRHRGPAPQAQAAAGNRVLLGAARARGCRAGGRRARPDRRRAREWSTRISPSPTLRGRRSARRSSSSRSGTSRRSGSRTCGRGSSARLRQRPPLIAVSAHTGRGLERLLGLVEAVFERYAGRIPTAELNRALQELREARQPPGPPRPAAQPPLRHAGELATAALPVLRERPRPRHPRLRLLGRERTARALRPRGRSRVHRLRHLRVKVVVVGAGSWGTAFACLLRDNGHDVTLAARDAAQADAINATGRNPRYAQTADLAGVGAAPIADAPIDGAELVVVAVPSRVFGDVVSGLPGDAPVLSLTKGLDPTTGRRLSTLVLDRPVAVLSGPNIADEIVRGLPAAAVVASDDLELAVRLQVAVHSVLFRVYVRTTSSGSSSARLRRTSSRSQPAARTDLRSVTTRRRRSSRAGSPRCAGSRSRPALDRTRSPDSPGWAT